LTAAVHASPEEVAGVLEEMIAKGVSDHLKAENKDYYISRIGMDKIEEKISKALVDYRSKYPLRRGYPREELRSRLFKDYSTKLFNALLEVMEQRGVVAAGATHLRPAEKVPEIDEKVKRVIQGVMEQMQKDIFSPPGLKELQEEISRNKQDPGEIIAYLEDEGKIIKIADGMYFTAEALDKARQMLADHFSNHSELGLAEARDIWGTSRKYALPLMEYFDRMKFTRRVGDNRILIGK
jgi:selenocysteine-specific elongation factor